MLPTNNNKESNKSLLFLSWESPWPPHSGAALRTSGLLSELSKAFNVELIVLTRQPLTGEQSTYLSQMAHRVIQLPLRDVSKADKMRALSRVTYYNLPYHSAVLQLSLSNFSAVRERILRFPGIVFTSVGHWGTLVTDRSAPNWILNQCDADVEFWRVYATQTHYPPARLAARINYRFARRHYPQIYTNVGRIISVCEEDRQHTLALAPQARVDIIENGVDCSYYVPRRGPRNGPPRLLFTGTSAARNMTALHTFVRDVFPLIRQQVPDVELLVGGNFNAKAQEEFASVSNMRFSGRVDDIRPLFDQSDVFVAPFAEVHGSKLKIAEAMAMAIPIVSSTQGIRGFPLINGRSVLIADNAFEFATHTVSLLRDPEHGFVLGQTARDLALSTIDWQPLGKRLVKIVKTSQEQITQAHEQL
ncbi:MAG: glycosyltransferase family 4 protein [Anaerolineae bacterium]